MTSLEVLECCPSTSKMDLLDMVRLVNKTSLEILSKELYVPLNTIKTPMSSDRHQSRRPAIHTQIRRGQVAGRGVEEETGLGGDEGGGGGTKPR